jgi:hypothetical protein
VSLSLSLCPCLECLCVCVSLSVHTTISHTTISLFILLYMCPHTTIYMQREEEKLRSDTARLELARARLAAASRCSVYLLSGTKVHILTTVQIPRASLLLPGAQFTSFYTTIYVSSSYCVLVYLCPHTTIHTLPGDRRCSMGLSFRRAALRAPPAAAAGMSSPY